MFLDLHARSAEPLVEKHARESLCVIAEAPHILLLHELEYNHLALGKITRGLSAHGVQL